MQLGKLSRQKKERRIVFGILVLILLLIFGAIYLYIDSRAYKQAKVEAGVKVAPQDLLKQNDPQAKFVTKDGKEYVLNQLEVGDHVLYVKSGWFTHKVILHVVDSIPPTAEAVEVYAEVGEQLQPEDFVKNVTDASNVQAVFEIGPDCNVAGAQRVVVSLTDQGGNKVFVETRAAFSPIRADYYMEINSENPVVEDLIVSADKYSTDFPLEKIDMNRLGEYEVPISVDGRLYTASIHVVDTKAPIVKVHELEWYIGVPIKPEYFIEEIDDNTEVTAEFVVEPDVSTEGTQAVKMRFTDAAGNTSEQTAKMVITVDTEAPQIVGAEDMIVYLGRGASYRKNVTIEDNCPEGLTLEVDSSQVNLAALGEYPVTYIARDYTGNESSVTINLTVEAQCYDLETVNEKADEILAKILTDDMSKKDQVQAIYNYVRGHVAYIGDSDKESYVKAAYEGLFNGRGDCFVYASTTKVLLDRAGIINMDIAKIPTRSHHYWNLVDIEDGHGWYHLDTTPRKDHVTIFLWDEQTLMNYSNSHYKSHNYDHELYPTVP